MLEPFDRPATSRAGRRPPAGRGKQRVRKAAAILAALAVAVVATVVVVITAGQTGSRRSGAHARTVPRRTAPRRTAPIRVPAPHSLEVVPFPGTPDASPYSQIAFPALAPSAITSIRVTGSESGDHAGSLRALPSRRGTAFVPAKPFQPGERATVVARVSSRAAAIASGARRGTALRFSFGIATAVPVPLPTSGPSTPQSTQSFHSEPTLHPPVVAATRDPDPGSGDTFVTAEDSPQQGPMILDNKGRTVWFRPIHNTHISAFNLNVQRYRGRPVLTWWQGRVNVVGVGTEGEGLIFDDHYRTVGIVHASEGYSADLHEFQLTPAGTALISVFAPVSADLSSVGGSSNGELLDSIVQEIDIRTGRLLWEWHAFGHVPLTATEIGPPPPNAPYDFFHINSIQQLPNGNLLISARNTWAVYEISRATGKVIWTLGGKDSSFKMSSRANFYWQHDAHLEGNTLTLFDDGAIPEEEPQSRALELHVDRARSRVTVARVYTHSPAVLSDYEGSMQTLDNGNLFVDWGRAPDLSEYSPGGKQIWNMSFTAPIHTYRAYRYRWNADPETRPAISVGTASGGKVTVYASWNGATNVASWQLVAGPSGQLLSPLAATASAGFETAITGSTTQPYVAVRALDSAGRVLATSAPVRR